MSPGTGAEARDRVLELEPRRFESRDFMEEGAVSFLRGEEIDTLPEGVAAVQLARKEDVTLPWPVLLVL